MHRQRDSCHNCGTVITFNVAADVSTTCSSYTVKRYIISCCNRLSNGDLTSSTYRYTCTGFKVSNNLSLAWASVSHNTRRLIVSERAISASLRSGQGCTSTSISIVQVIYPFCQVIGVVI